ncbi:MAG TPA: L-ribulose-5-phosphate 4-epimerase AraD [Acidobacteriota bacterium]|nr:L-ribulose-5-phosphate 4-epimerase AraD [Acidobacteriota bacterium]
MQEALQILKKEVLAANLLLVESGLVVETFGNVSGILRDHNIVVIKPSGVPYGELKAEHMVAVDLEGKVMEGDLRPSSDLPTHLELYRSFRSIGGVSHSHSLYATTWAQAHLEIPCLGTTHADYFNGPVPLTDRLSAQEIEESYELNTGKMIVRRFQDLSPEEFPGVLVAGHGPFTWGPNPTAAAKNSVVLEWIYHLAYLTRTLNPEGPSIRAELLQKHFCRKHGPSAYYGQTTKTG